MRIVAIMASAALVCAVGSQAGIAQPSDGDQPVADNQARAKAKSERRICHSVTETGSIAKQRRQCYTRAEWDRIAEAARARGQRLQSDMASGIVSN